MKTRLGTPMYMAPEIHDKTVKYQGQDADCFAFGVSLFVARVIGYPWKVPDLIKDESYNRFAGDYGINADKFWEEFADRELTDEFKANYQTWLQREVYNTEIQWELLLEDVENPKSKLII